MYTRCPNCQTYFKISADQLKKAGGRVRCGQCMKVFNSLGNLLEELPVSLNQAHKPKVPAQNATPPAAKVPAAPPPSKPAPPPAVKVAATAPAPRPAPPPSAPPARPKITRPTEPPAPKPAVAVPEQIASPPPPLAEEDIKFFADATKDEGVTFHAEFADTIASSSREEETLDLTGESKIDNLDVGPHSSVRDLIPYPGPPGGQPLFGNAFWGVGVVVLLLLFIVQYSYYMRDDLARYPELRPWIQDLCNIAQCELPMQQDIDNIKLTHRDITQHPRVKGALLINAVFVNKAGFAQPFPVMQITLSDLSGRVIAKRRFQPVEYLDADVNIRRGMPPDNPIQIVLEIADPGKDAENFEFNFFYQNS